jgi:RHS repeat-associated protein
VKIVDESGKIVNRYKYDEWGNILEETEEIENPLKYTGEYYDEESGMYYLRARYYDPVIGRFVAKDSYEGEVTNPLSLNLYIYCYNNPLGYIDPSGHVPWGFYEKSEEFANGFIDKVSGYGGNLISNPGDTLLASGGVVLGGIGVAGSGIIEVLSGGSATPIVIATGGFSANAVASSAVDLKFIATGELDKKGSFNPLESGSKLLFKGAGEGVEFILDSASAKDYEIGDYTEVVGGYVFEGADFYFGVKGVSQGFQKIGNKSYRIYYGTLQTGNMSSVYKNVSKADKVGAGIEIIYTIKGWINKLQK